MSLILNIQIGGQVLPLQELHKASQVSSVVCVQPGAKH